MTRITIRKNVIIVVSACLVLTIGITSCVGDLNTTPIYDNEMTSEDAYGADEETYLEGLSKIYAGLSIGGTQAREEEADIDGVEKGSHTSFIRILWNMQDLSSDLAHCCWNDVGIPDFNHISWSASNVWIKAMYYRIYYQINVSNAYLRETTDEKLTSRGCSEELKEAIKTYRAEARFLRALMYMYALDLYRNVPMVDENSPIGGELPEQTDGTKLFDYVESELFACEKDMIEPTVGWSDDYGHASKAAAWAALSRLYLNAEVYTGEHHYTECITYSKKVMETGYSLDETYGNVFRADNDHSTEIIFPCRFEGEETMTQGGMTALLCWGAATYQTETNARGAWQGVRALRTLYEMFEREISPENDVRRKMLRTEGTASIDITNESQFADNGIPVTKYYNVNSDGSLPPSVEAWTDFPLFRLGEIYLNYAEAVLRGGAGASRAEALERLNELRRRAYSGSAEGEISDAEFTLNFMLDERGREMFYEAQRRTDLIRFGLFTGGDYLWPWKGGVAEGQSIDRHYALFPLPSDDIGSNGNLKQNIGY